MAWNMIVGGAAVATAVGTGSLALVGFGVNAVVDSSVSWLLVWRFRVSQAEQRAIRIERLALRLAAAAFLIIGLYVSVRALLALAEGH